MEYAADQKTVFRAGFAVAYSRAGGVGGRAGDGTGAGQTGFGSSLILPTAVSSGATAGPSYYLNNSAAFQAAGIANTDFGGPGFVVPPPTGASASQLTVNTGNYVNSKGAYVNAGGSPAYADPYLSGRAPEFIFYNFGLQRALTNALTLTLNYSGSQSHFVAGAPVAGFWSGTMDPRYLVSLASVVGTNGTSVLGNAASTTNVARAQAADSSVTVPYQAYVSAGNVSSTASIGRMLRPFPQYSAPPSALWDNTSNLNYNAFELTLKLREYKGVNFTVNWTYSKNVGDDNTVRASYAVPAAASSNGIAMPGLNRADRGLVITDIPENLNIFGYGILPFGKGKLGGDNWAVRNLAGGWTLSGIFRYNSGTPILITGAGCNAPGQGTCMPDLAPGRTLGSSRINGGFGGPGVTYANFTQKNYLDTAAFAPLNVFPLAGNTGPTLAQCPSCITKIGTSPRDATDLRSPSAYNLDASLQRSFDITRERVKFVFRADCFDVTNKVTFSLAQTQSIGITGASNASAAFGRLSGFSGNRRWQFSGRITF